MDRKKTVEEQFRTLGDPVPHAPRIKANSVPAPEIKTLDWEPLKPAGIRGVMDPPTLSRPAGYWQAAIAEPPNLWYRFWTRFLLGWKWIDCRK